MSGGDGSTPARPKVQHQGPAGHCVIHGKAVGWLSCSAYGAAMLIDRSTLGKQRPTGCDVRARTNDTTGGLTLQQVAASARHWGVVIAVHAGNDVGRPKEVAEALRAGRGVIVQGYTGVLVRTTFRSTQGGVNHLVYVNEGRGFKDRGKGYEEPSEVLVYDPAADGRDRAYHVDESPSWWPWSLLLSFAAHLHPWGEDDRRVLGAGRLYVGLGPDTEPHYHQHYAGRQTVPFPDITHVKVAAGRKANVRNRPDRVAASDIVGHLANGATFRAYQLTNDGATLAGSSRWYGNHDGTEWIHASSLIDTGPG